MAKKNITASEHSQCVDKTSCTHANSMQPSLNLPPFSGCIGYYWERKLAWLHLVFGWNIWVLVFVLVDYLFIYAAWNGKKGRAPVTAQWFIPYRR